ncbi:zinc ribbon domain-containing protein [Haloterrigena sp. SYSU A558-1]|uniref:Zinc ribbon domain-containing protein n=1 Tax=Haloterrigena gelatinilytica TaxID=2741724 RepID=A0A8J8GJS7_9EURY|nr:zinc ribbon domain-containing protein [Haloterrigena gelatinilytica]NUB90951.1 zinc ribbon domain-containing protein [Haloterrigena gelatinilytica]NUC73231.1 zinc ribbon domain-containing protein [Haloterrigena gelatinilytica]
MTWLRAVVAAGLSMVFPGAGHVVIRDWLRALLFAGLYFVTFWLFFPVDQIATAESFAEAMTITSEVDMLSQLTLLFVNLIAAFDAIIRALEFSPNAAGDDGGATCPECGKELDEDLEFCHWCTARLEPSPDEEPAQT